MKTMTPSSGSTSQKRKTALSSEINHARRPSLATIQLGSGRREAFQPADNSPVTFEQVTRCPAIANRSRVPRCSRHCGQGHSKSLLVAPFDSSDTISY